jgi:hypothetical protein
MASCAGFSAEAWSRSGWTYRQRFIAEPIYLYKATLASGNQAKEGAHVDAAVNMRRGAMSTANIGRSNEAVSY